MEARERLGQCDFPLASLDWSPASPDHSATAPRLPGKGVRFLFCAKHAEDVPTKLIDNPLSAKTKCQNEND